MSKINSTKKVVLEDFPADVRPWLKKLVDPLNRFLEQAYYALVNGLTTTDNLKAQTNTLTIASNATYPMKYAWRLNERPTAILVASIVDNTGVAVEPYAMSWIYNNGTVEVTLNGLAAREHTIKLLGLV